jgi:hypothetical protein
MTVQPPHELDDTDEPPPGDITKRRVVMRNFVGFDPNGNALYHEAVDYVKIEHLEAYTADARTRWGFVEVGDEPDAGPSGYHGAYQLPTTVNHPDAGQFLPPTSGSRVERALLEADARRDEYPIEPAPPEAASPTYNPTPSTPTDPRTQRGQEG